MIKDKSLLSVGAEHAASVDQVTVIYSRGDNDKSLTEHIIHLSMYLSHIHNNCLLISLIRLMFLFSVYVYSFILYRVLCDEYVIPWMKPSGQVIRSIIRYVNVPIYFFIISMIMSDDNGDTPEEVKRP